MYASHNIFQKDPYYRSLTYYLMLHKKKPHCIWVDLCHHKMPLSTKIKWTTDTNEKPFGLRLVGCVRLYIGFTNLVSSVCRKWLFHSIRQAMFLYEGG